MTDGFVQQHTRPAWPKHDIHFAGRGIDRVNIDERLTDGFIDLGLPLFRRRDIEPRDTSATAGGGGFAATIALDRDADVQADEGTVIVIEFAAGAQDGDGALVAGQRGRDLHDAGMSLTGIGVHGLEQGDLVGESHLAERIMRLVIGLIGAGRICRRHGQVNRLAFFSQHRGLGGAIDGIERQFGAVGEADSLAGDDAEAEALIGAIG